MAWGLRIILAVLWTCCYAWTFSLHPFKRFSKTSKHHRHYHTISSNRIDRLDDSSIRQQIDRFNEQELDSDRFIDAAAAVTQSSCRLLGTKSIGVDYGLVKTGVAMTVGYEPKPITILRDLNRTQVVQNIVRIAQLERASQIVVGLPLHKNGTVAEQTNLTMDFCYELAACVLRELGPQVPIVLWDERYTSKAALALGGGSKSSLYGTLDDSAACIILDCYYKSEYSEDAQVVQLDPAIREECLHYFEGKQMEEQRKIQQALEERELKILRRKEAIARFQTENTEHAVNAGKTKKKKRKK
ncbi:putative holliday junction resolvase [Fistulifera solaris]|jgi:putative transcription antitermination factor YqgF|uniref:Putative holliday junction resolvase n=1 Tax=Fistulifera solaris TaxID=1519565 RepID=A0A1Z5JEP1_FISSO|nr:putative holliday junction resolvase [Fistulifera solaris]|eukprot:GAX12231.1 putative holliday junction resolvase [Fistulifera solaris]